MAAPHVAGVMAKHLSSEQPPMNPDELTARLLDEYAFRHVFGALVVLSLI